ncbi:hypothetical protein FNY97_13730, partial [Corynebacterium hiratae]
IPPGNRLEALKGDRRGQYSIRINDQWRICFRWTALGPEEVEILTWLKLVPKGWGGDGVDEGLDFRG